MTDREHDTAKGSAGEHEGDRERIEGKVTKVSVTEHDKTLLEKDF